MGKLVKLIVVLVIVAVAGYVFVEYSQSNGEAEQASSERTDEGLRVEEKYGFTTETVGS